MNVSLSSESHRVLTALAARRFTSWTDVDRRLRAVRRELARGFDRLLALEDIGVTPFPHQQEAALRVLQQMRGRALLADEVGLGKTIEAGLVLKEYFIRGLARNALILAPAPLTEQWRVELAEKFGVDALVLQNHETMTPDGCLIASLDWAKRPEHAARLSAVAWDVVIVDEAHRLKNRRTAAWQFVDALRKKYLLLLTATPIQNDLEELYNLVTLLKPGLLHTYSAFRHRFMAGPRTAKEVSRLREHVADVMIRTTRSQCGLALPPRLVEAIPVCLTEAEKSFYHDVLTLARRVYAQRSDGHVLPLIVLLRELCSSPRAAGRTLRALSQKGELPIRERREAAGLAQRAQELEQRNAKLHQALSLLGGCPEQVVVFTEFRATQELLAEALTSRGIPVVQFHGGMSAEERGAAVEAFRSHGGVLISTEAGGEGQNWQHCRVVVNYDLPWNPMRLEQRIGRVHRLGQTRPAQIVNLYAADTVEASVYQLLEEKLQLFRQVIGELDLILAATDDGTSFEVRMGRLALAAKDENEMTRAFQQLGQQLAARRARREAVVRRNAQLLDEAKQPCRQDGTPGDAAGSPVPDGSEPAALERERHGLSVPVACLIHPLALDAAFVQGVITEQTHLHPRARDFHLRLRQLRFGNVQARPDHRRVVLQRQLLVWFKVSYKSDETREELCTVAVDPLTERARLVDDEEGYIDAALDADWLSGPHGQYGMQRLYREAVRQLHKAAKAAGRRHQAEADARLARDRARLDAYYDALRAEELAAVAQQWRRAETVRMRAWLRESLWASGAETQPENDLWPDPSEVEARAGQVLERLAAEQRARLEELQRKYQVRVEATPVATALLWAPKVECTYKLFSPGRRDLVVYYDPLTDALVDWTCEVCGDTLDSAWMCRAGEELVCSGCYAPCRGCAAPLCVDCVRLRCHVCDGALCHHCASPCPELAGHDSGTLVVCPACRSEACPSCRRLKAFLVV